ncbi:hypothetical protein B0H14DRAFT_3456193 [Mycena olivaceomarginata]|nr:hypothetical protein B0H14DRAFT_3456193 [Mycena olivaceomarginata]
MKTPTSEQLTSILLAVIALIPSQGVRYTAFGLLLAAIILCKVHLQNIFKRRQWRPPKAIPNSGTKGGAFAKLPTLFRALNVVFLLSETRVFSWKGFRSLSKDIGERITRFRSLSNEIGECVRCVKDIRTAVELILEAERQRKLAINDYNIPAIITTDLTADNDKAPPQLTTSPVQNLSPTAALVFFHPTAQQPVPAASLDVPSSPTHTDDGASIITVPPSPTLFSHSSRRHLARPGRTFNIDGGAWTVA